MKSLIDIRIAIAFTFFALIGFTSNAYVSTYYTASSQLSSGRWVKIKVTETGMQEITYEELSAMGFSDPSKVSVYGYGGLFLNDNTFHYNLPDDLPAQPVYRGENKIIFYGESNVRADIGTSMSAISVSRNQYSNGGYYFLSEDASISSSSPTTKSISTSNYLEVSHHSSILFYEYEINNPSEGGANFYGYDFVDIPEQTFTFEAKDPYLDDNVAYFGYNFVANSEQKLKLGFEISDAVTIYSENHRNISPVYSSSINYYNTKDGLISFATRDNGDNIYNFKAYVPSSYKYSYAAIDRAYMTYNRNNNIENEAQLQMTFIGVNSNYNFIIKAPNDNIQVWNVCSPIGVYAYQTTYNNSTKEITGSFDKSYTSSTNGHARLIAFNPSQKQHSVEFVCEVNNQNLHSNPSPHLLIITTNQMKSYAEQIAQLHRDHQNMTVYVYTQEEIFNEFSSGTPTAMGIRRFVKMFYDRNSSRFKYLLLFGAGSWDNRGLIYTNADRLLTYQTEIIDDIKGAATCYTSDSYFGMMSDEYSPSLIHREHAQVSVGRIPVSTQEDAQAVVDKISSYLNNPPTIAVYNRALLMCDNGDNNGHLTQSEATCDTITKYSPSTTVTKIYNGLYPWDNKDAKAARNAIIQALNYGQAYFCYTGHGKSDSWTAENLWHKIYVRENEYAYPPIGFLATCDSFGFDRLDDNITEAMLYKKNGGAIAIVAACRTVYKEYNQYLSTAFAREFFSASSADNIGDVFMRARNSVATLTADRGLSVNNLCFNLAGDPALPVYASQYDMQVTSINNNEVSTDNDSTAIELNALVKNKIKGNITDSSGTITSFNGTASFTIYEAPITNKTYDYRSIYPTEKDTSVSVVRNEDILCEFTAIVKDGVFESEFITPQPMRNSAGAHISFFAIDDNKTLRAKGYLNNMIITENNDLSNIDTTAPVIESCYINSPDFENGDIVNSDITLHAIILPDESGLNVSTGTIGTGTKLTLDGKTTFPQIRTTLATDNDGKTTISFPINQLEDGYHTLTLSVADNTGNRSSKTISFLVINQTGNAVLTTDKQPARSNVTFNVESNLTNITNCRLIIEDNAGNTIFSKENCILPYSWDLKDNNGNRVAEGSYKCYVLITDGKYYTSSPRIQLVVIEE